MCRIIENVARTGVKWKHMTALRLALREAGFKNFTIGWDVGHQAYILDTGERVYGTDYVAMGLEWAVSDIEHQHLYGIREGKHHEGVAA